MSNVKFTATKLNGTGKRGILKPDADGYYEMPIGGLNTFNSAGQYYVLDGAKQLFEESSVFMRRIKNGCLKGEVGHPKKLPGMSMDDFVNRILTIDEKNVCCHFKEVWLDESFGKNNQEYKNPDLVAIMAKIKPSGPKGDFLQKSFDNPDENVCFSIRAFTRDYYQRGQTYRVLTQIISFDSVIEPGISNATKWHSPSLESISECAIRQVSFENIVNNQLDYIATEDSKILALDTINTLNKQQPKLIVKPPIISKW